MENISEKINEKGISEVEKRYWVVADAVKKLQKEDASASKIISLEDELKQLAKNEHPLLSYYQKLLEQHNADKIEELEQYYENLKLDASTACDEMTAFLEADFIKTSESIFSTFMEVLLERKRVLDKDKDQSTVTSFNRKEQAKNSKDPSLPYTKMLLNENDSVENVLDKLMMHKKKPPTNNRTSDRQKQNDIDQDILLIRQHVTYRPEKIRRQNNKRQRRERVIERDDIYSEDEIAVNNDEDRGTRPRRRARRRDVKETYSDDISDE